MFHSTRAFHPAVGLAAVVLIATLALAAASTNADTASRQAPAASGPAAPAPFVLTYQGRLSDPLTGVAKPDGSYQMAFALYEVAAGGAPFWTESKDVQVRGGLFTTLLGDVTPLDPARFDGQALWLGVTAGGDPQASPRLPVSFVAYAMYANRADSARSASTAELAANADRFGGQPPASYAAASHTHDAAAITAGVLSTDRFSAYADLATEARIGEAAGQVAAGNHVHSGATIVDNSIGTADLADGSVTSAKLADGGVATADLANSSVTTAKIANGAVTADKLASDVVPKFFTLEPYAAYLEGSATFTGGYGPHAGINMPDGSSSSFAFGFTIPPDYAPGVPLNVRLVWHTASTRCGIELRPNFISVARPGRTHLVGESVSTGLDAVGGTVLDVPATANLSGEKSYTITSPVRGEKLLPGDSVIFGLYRCYGCTADTCTGTLKVQGIQVTY
ncbi:MAG: hypothetical protein AUK03_10990 [Anaerolineae bacterium CG2_30_64_16]|nr:MAG: hypothetical protein AUK03_10990 [Anaerolineae bacterium CG2_30_64_16]